MNKEIKKTLMNAVVCGTLKNVQKAFKKHKLKLDDSFFDYELLKAALHRNHQTIVNFLLKIGCRVTNPNKHDSEETPLHLAVKNVRHDIIIFIGKLISKGASIYDKNSSGETPLYVAFKKGYFDAVYAVVLVLHNCSFNFNPANKDDILHFHIVCIQNHYSAVERFLKCGFDPNITLSLDSEKYAGINPIQFAIKRKYFELFTRLIRYSDLSIKNQEGLTHLHMIYYSHIPYKGKYWIEQALKYGKDKRFINSEDKYGLSHFHLCCMLDEPDFVQAFIDNGVNVNSSVSLKSTIDAGFMPLHFAVTNGCKEVIKVLLENGADPNKTDVRGETPLHLACKGSENFSSDTVKMLLDYKASPVIPDTNGCTFLHEIFYFKCGEVMQIFDTLISKAEWGSTNYTDTDGLSLFHIACTTNNVSQVEKFLDSGVSIDICVSSGEYSGFSALHFAVRYNQKDIVQVLLKRNAKVNVKINYSKATPLHFACELTCSNPFNQKKFFYKDCSDQLDIIKSLLLYGADIDAKGSLGQTPLLHACYCNYIWPCVYNPSTEEHDKLSNEFNINLQEVIKILILNSANINVRTEDQSSILHIIISRCRILRISEKLIKFLVVSGVDVNAVDDAGLTPLHVAVRNSNKELVRSLLKHNANPNIKYNNFEIALHAVISSLNRRINFLGDFEFHESDYAIKEDIFCALLEYGSDVNMRDQYGKTMLHDAIANGKIFIIEKLLYYGADINMNDSCISEYLKWENDQQTNPSYGKLFQIFFIHVQKLLALRLPVNQELQNCCILLQSVYKKKFKTFHMAEDLLDNVFDNCVNELDKMKNIKIDSYTSLYNILLKCPHEIAKHVKNSSLIKILKVPNVDNNFPLYSYLLQLQFKRGLLRSQALQSAEKALKNVLNINLPDLCNDLVLKYLENQDIANLKEAAPVKCNLKRKLHDNSSNQTGPVPNLQKKRTMPTRDEVEAHEDR